MAAVDGKGASYSFSPLFSIAAEGPLRDAPPGCVAVFKELKAVRGVPRIGSVSSVEAPGRTDQVVYTCIQVVSYSTRMGKNLFARNIIGSCNLADKQREFFLQHCNIISRQRTLRPDACILAACITDG